MKEFKEEVVKIQNDSIVYGVFPSVIIFIMFMWGGGAKLALWVGGPPKNVRASREKGTTLRAVYVEILNLAPPVRNP